MDESAVQTVGLVDLTGVSLDVLDRLDEPRLSASEALLLSQISHPSRSVGGGSES